MIKEFKNLISNKTAKIYDGKKSGDFVTHQELGLVYSDIRNDIQEIDCKFSIKFADVDIKFANVRKDIVLLDDKLTGEIRKMGEESHRELIEVKNEIIARLCVSEGNITSLQDGVSTLQDNVMSLQDSVSTLQDNVMSLQDSVSTLQTDVVMIKDYLFTELTPRVESMESDLSLVKDYLFTKLTSDIKTVVKECLAEQALSR